MERRPGRGRWTAPTQLRGLAGLALVDDDEAGRPDGSGGNRLEAALQHRTAHGRDDHGHVRWQSRVNGRSPARSGQQLVETDDGIDVGDGGTGRSHNSPDR